MENDNIFFRYISTRDHYYKNMEESLAKGEYRKASELLWGAITQAIKALASLPPSPKEIHTHKEFFLFVKEVSRETADEEYFTLFNELNALHKNFYDEIFPSESFPIFLRKAKIFLEKTDELIKRKLENIRKR